MKKRFIYMVCGALAFGTLVAATTSKTGHYSNPVNPQKTMLHQSDRQAPKAVAGDVVEVAMASSDHSTLVEAIKAAGLVETLKGAGPFTVFAPTNAAFDLLPEGTVDGLLKPEKKTNLTKVLTYHVVPGIIKAADLKNGKRFKTIQGKQLTVTVQDGKVKINGANITTADIEASNGVVHVIDAVLMP